jgi:hypothetical protein
MSNELQKNVDLMDQFLSQANEEETDGRMLQEMGSGDFIPILTVGYASSGAVQEGLARPGEFILSGQSSLGNEIEAVCLDYRAHAVVVDTDSNLFEGHYYVSSEWCKKQDKSLMDNEGWRDFTTQNLPKGKEMQKGADLFLYIPSITQFVTLFCKKTLADSAHQVYKASRKTQLVGIKTVRMTNKAGSRSWFTFNVTRLNRGIVGSPLDVKADIAMPRDLFQKYYAIFKEPTNVEKTTDDGVER